MGGWFVYHESRLAFIAVCFKSGVPLSSPKGAVTATREAFGDDCPASSSNGVAGSVLLDANDRGGD